MIDSRNTIESYDGTRGAIRSGMNANQIQTMATRLAVASFKGGLRTTDPDDHRAAAFTTAYVEHGLTGSDRVLFADRVVNTMQDLESGL
jgi:hypothetical protein